MRRPHPQPHPRHPLWQMMDGLSVTVRSLIAAAVGYVVVLVTGKLAIDFNLVGGDNDFWALGLAAITVIVLAPLGSLLAVIAAGSPLRRRRLDVEGRVVLSMASAVVVGASAATYLLLGRPVGITTFLLGASALLVTRIALVERMLSRRAS